MLVEDSIRRYLRTIGNRSRGPLAHRFTSAPGTPYWIAGPVQRLRSLHIAAFHGERFSLEEDGADSFVSAALKMVQEIDSLTAALTSPNDV